MPLRERYREKNGTQACRGLDKRADLVYDEAGGAAGAYGRVRHQSD